MVRSTKPSLLRRFGALVAAAAMLVVLPAGVSTASAASDDADMLTVTMTRTDALGDEVYVGDTLTYSFTNTNNTSSAFTAFPAESNLSGVLTTGTPNCRYENLAGGASYPCSTASHTITADDLTAGSFTPRTVWKATSDRGGTQVLQDNIVSTGDTVTVKEGKRPDPAYIEKVLRDLSLWDKKDTQIRRLSSNGSFGFQKVTYLIDAHRAFEHVLVIADGDQITDTNGEILAELTRPAPGVTYVGNGRPRGPKKKEASPMS